MLSKPVTRQMSRNVRLETGSFSQTQGAGEIMDGGDFFANSCLESAKNSFPRSLFLSLLGLGKRTSFQRDVL